MNQSKREPILLPAEQAIDACQVLARAFQHDPLMAFVLPNERRRAALLPALFRVTVHYCLRYGQVYASPGLEGIACWLPPDHTTPTLGRLLSVGLRFPPLRLGPRGLWRLGLTERYAAQQHAFHTHGPHWYLWALGVDPPYQGQGIGSALLRVVCQQADAHHLPCYLETQNPRNVGFYERHGFQVVSETAIPHGQGLRLWAMLREAQPSPGSFSP
ncbi:GNAT family N-acetyltransferase [Thermogemmatispora sp.]|uniref:GNAT family N-acetyltransferase n=1 Tax=Thermogemmatispora sp. TaxID=1968838 RepID=UPI001DDE7917|nr:GNAT family N-acetyltransferase [Thermogemmatispora sp.]MBX5452108.1 GNAT family N-acetyltransferase [Thermogemmatispora sp.]